MNLSKKPRVYTAMSLYFLLYALSMYIVGSTIYTTAKIVWWIIHKLGG